MIFEFVIGAVVSAVLTMAFLMAREHLRIVKVRERSRWRSDFALLEVMIDMWLKTRIYIIMRNEVKLVDHQKPTTDIVHTPITDDMIKKYTSEVMLGVIEEMSAEQLHVFQTVYFSKEGFQTFIAQLIQSKLVEYATEMNLEETGKMLSDRRRISELQELENASTQKQRAVPKDLRQDKNK